MMFFLLELRIINFSESNVEWYFISNELVQFRKRIATRSYVDDFEITYSHLSNCWAFWKYELRDDGGGKIYSTLK